MDTLFLKPTLPLEDVRSSNFQQYYPSISASMRYANLEPYIIQAADHHLIQHLGDTFYGELVTYSKLASNLQVNAILNGALHHLRTALANYTIYRAMPTLNNIISDAGVQQNRTDKSSNSPQWAFNAARWSALITAETALDRAINHLYQHKADNILDAWATSDGFKFLFTDFIGGLTDIRDISPIRSMRGYLALIPYMRNAENQVRNICGQRQYDDIKSKLLDTDPKYKEIIGRIRRYVLAQSLFHAIPVMTFYNNGQDLVLLGDTDGINKELGPNSKEHQQNLNIMMQNLENQASAEFADVKNYLAMYSEFFTLYAADTHQPYRSKSVMSSEDGIGGVMI